MLKAMFVYTFDSGVNFGGENFFAGTIFRENLFSDRQKNAKIAIIRTRNSQKFTCDNKCHTVSQEKKESDPSKRENLSLPSSSYQVLL